MRVVIIVSAALGIGILTYAYVDSGMEHFEPGIARTDAYTVGPAPNELTLYFSIGAGDRVDDLIITEEARRVLVTVRTSVYVPPRGVFKDLAARLQQRSVTLTEPLGDRSVIDATTGRELARRSPQP